MCTYSMYVIKSAYRIYDLLSPIHTERNIHIEDTNLFIPMSVCVWKCRMCRAPIPPGKIENFPFSTRYRASTISALFFRFFALPYAKIIDLVYFEEVQKYEYTECSCDHKKAYFKLSIFGISNSRLFSHFSKKIVISHFFELFGFLKNAMEALRDFFHGYQKGKRKFFLVLFLRLPTRSTWKTNRFQ